MELNFKRLRKYRANNALIDIFCDVVLNPKDFVQPVFIIEGSGLKQEIPNFPDVYRYSIDEAIKFMSNCASFGIKMFALFPVLDESLKNDMGSEALNSNGLMYRAIKEIKNALPDLILMADVALDPYTSHGHDGVLQENGYLDNDRTIAILAKYSVLLAEAGADCVSPSDMMDGRIAYINTALEEHGHVNTLVAAYSTKFNSSLYGPFRNAVKSNQSGYLDKSSYQINPGNLFEAELELFEDVQEAADILIVKPASIYLDIIVKASEYKVPVFAYHVSGEYSMLKLAAKEGIVSSYDAILKETMTAIKRAGAKCIITYAALDIAKLLNK